jgi:hypothetical protein
VGWISDRPAAADWSALVGLQPCADRPRVGLDVVVAVDVELHQQQQAVEALAVLERVAARVES